MSYSFRPDETLSHALRRIAREQAAGAIERIEDASAATLEEDIHDVRKALKRTRSLLRLMSAGLDPEVFDRENRTCRAAGHALGPIREAHVLQRTLDRLAGGCDLADVRDEADALRDGVTETLPRDIDDRFDEVSLRLKLLRRRAKGWSLEHGRRSIVAGYRRLYRRGRSAFEAARLDPSMHVVHDWRKRMKDAQYTLELISAADPAAFTSLQAEADAIGELLGEIHDLDVATAFVARHPSAVDSPRLRLAELARVRREHLLAEAFTRGADFYAEPSSQFADRIATALLTSLSHDHTSADRATAE